MKGTKEALDLRGKKKGRTLEKVRGEDLGRKIKGIGSQKKGKKGLRRSSINEVAR